MNKYLLIILLSLSLNATEIVEKAKPVQLGIMANDEKVFTLNDGRKITRVMTSCAKNAGWLTPMVPAPGVHSIGEIEILNSMNDKESLLIDMRIESDFYENTIPSSINIPFTNIGMEIERFGCKKVNGKMNCDKAKTIFVFCNGPVCHQSPIGIRRLVELGFPADKINYYRGGMLNWMALGFKTVPGEF